MPWLKLDFKERDKKNKISSKFSVQGIPKFILLDGDTGDIISEDLVSYCLTSNKIDTILHFAAQTHVGK